jgi:hypothetical protein
LKHDSDWSYKFSYEGFEKKSNHEDVLKDAHEALTRFYQKETRRSKTLKQKKHCWQ